MAYTYLILNLASVIVPFLCSFHPRLQFQRKWTLAIPAIVIVGLLFVGWDMIFTSLGIWGFNRYYVTGKYFHGLPLEEMLFFLCIPYACLFSYHSMFTLWPARFLHENYSSKLTWILIFLCIAGIVLFYEKSYTTVTAAGLLFFLIWFGVVRKRPWIGKLYTCYALMLLPFLIVNGILTGSFTEAPVVWYNPSGIAGPRIATIPIEDVFYGLLLFGLQVALYEHFLMKKNEKNVAVQKFA